MRFLFKRTKAWALLLTVLLHPLAAAAQKVSLCATEEKTFFSCSIYKKAVSLCGSADLSESVGYLRYIFGPPGREPELVYPRARTHPKNAFTTGLYSLGSTSAISNFQFSIGENVYTLYHYQSANAPTNLFGIAVGKAADSMAPDRLTYLKCNRSSVAGNFVWADKLQIPDVEMKKRVHWPAFD